MATTFECPGCGETVSVEGPAGEVVPCPRCGRDIAVPPAPVVLDYAGAPSRWANHEGLADVAFIISFVGLVGLVVTEFAAIVGLIGAGLGTYVLVKSRRRPNRYGQRHWVVAAVYLGGVSVFVAIAMLII